MVADVVGNVEEAVPVKEAVPAYEQVGQVLVVVDVVVFTVEPLEAVDVLGLEVVLVVMIIRLGQDTLPLSKRLRSLRSPVQYSGRYL